MFGVWMGERGVPRVSVLGAAGDGGEQGQLPPQSPSPAAQVPEESPQPWHPGASRRCNWAVSSLQHQRLLWHLAMAVARGLVVARVADPGCARPVSKLT